MREALVHAEVSSTQRTVLWFTDSNSALGVPAQGLAENKAVGMAFLSGAYTPKNEVHRQQKPLQHLRVPVPHSLITV